MRLKATPTQRILMLAFMLGVGLWSAWPDRARLAFVLVAGLVAAFLLLRRR